MLTEIQKHHRTGRIGKRYRVMPTMMTLETLPMHVDVMPNGCWQWRGKPVQRSGYGRKMRGKKSTYAHRAVWELVNGTIPEGLKVLHHCDNRICVNPDHLFLGTIQDNHDDCCAKGRQRRGVQIHFAKLTDAQVREIRSLYRWRSPTASLVALARKFNVSVGTIGKVVNRQLWKHVA